MATLLSRIKSSLSKPDTFYYGVAGVRLAESEWPLNANKATVEALEKTLVELVAELLKETPERAWVRQERQNGLVRFVFWQPKAPGRIHLDLSVGASSEVQLRVHRPTLHV